MAKIGSVGNESKSVGEMKVHGHKFMALASLDIVWPSVECFLAINGFQSVLARRIIVRIQNPQIAFIRHKMVDAIRDKVLLIFFHPFPLKFVQRTARLQPWRLQPKFSSSNEFALKEWRQLVFKSVKV